MKNLIRKTHNAKRITHRVILSLIIAWLLLPQERAFAACDTDEDCLSRGPGFICNVTNSQCEWQPPIGIPKPTFGIEETYRMYDNVENRNPNLNYTQNSEGGYYTHYVDNTHPAATDTGNPYGTASKPRRTIPFDLPAGSVVEVRGTTANGWGECNITGVGTVEKPIFVRGVNMPRVPMLMDVGFYGDTRYIIVEGISFFSGVVVSREGGTFDTSYISVRNCDFYGNENDGGFGIDSWTPSAVNQVVLYNNKIHDNGIWDPEKASGDRDIGGIGVGDTSYLWVLDNEMYHNEMDGIQINGARYVYVGRNIAHHNKQAGFWTKTAQDIIFSENTSYGHRPSSSSFGAGMGFQYDPKRVWFLFNTVYDNETGIGCGSGNVGGREEIYFMGNVIYDVTYGFQLNDLNPPQPAELIGNTIYNSTYGIVNGYYQCKLEMANNIIAGVTGYHIYFSEYGTGSKSNIKNTLFSQPVKINWDDRVYNSVASFQSGEKKGSGCIEADPRFVDAANNNFNLQSVSPAIDSGILSDAYQRFSDLYGIDIKKDIAGKTRPQGADWDLGAYEYALQGAILYGDVSGNGEISAYDAALTAQYAVDLITLTPDQIKAADVSGNGEVSAYDAALIAQRAVGLINRFPIE